MWAADPPPAEISEESQRENDALNEFWHVFGGYRWQVGDGIPFGSYTFRMLFRYPARPLDHLELLRWREFLEGSALESQAETFLSSLRDIGCAGAEGHQIAFRVDTQEVVVLSTYQDTPFGDIGLTGETYRELLSSIYTIDGVESVRDLIELVSQRTLDRINGIICCEDSS